MEPDPVDTARYRAAQADPTAPGASEYIAYCNTIINTNIQPLTEPPAVPEPTQPVHIATLDELMSSHAVIVAKEVADAASLTSLASPTPDVFRPQLFQWAAAGFPDMYIIHAISVTPPSICADGVTRSFAKYVEYCLKTDMGTIIQSMAALMRGIQPSWSAEGNTIRIHVSRSS